MTILLCLIAAALGLFLGCALSAGKVSDLETQYAVMSRSQRHWRDRAEVAEGILQIGRQVDAIESGILRRNNG